MREIKYKCFNSILNHKFTLILLHGMNMEIKYLYKIVKKLQNNNKNLKIILPIANRINIDWPTEKEYNILSWYNYYTRYDNENKHDIIDINQFNIQTENIYKILDREIELLKNSKSIVISGISQGGTLAFNIGINYKYKLGGIIGIHTIFMNNIINFNNNYNLIPIYLFSGDSDNIYNINFQNISLNILRERKYNIYWNIEKNLGHCTYSKNEIKFLLNSLNKIFNN